MIALGNFLLAVATLIFLWLCKMGLFSKTIGAFWPIGLFFTCLAIVTGIILKQGGFGWVGPPTGKRTMYVVLGFLLILAGNRYFSGNHEMPFVSQLSAALAVVVPILLLISAGVLLNSNFANISPHFYKTPVYAALMATAGGLALVFIIKIGFVAAYYLGGNVSQDTDAQRKVREIEALDKMATLDLIYYAHPYHQNGVRKRALKRIKSRPDWQEELVRNLQGDTASEVFTFLAYNEVKDKKLFAEALRQGILVQAKLIREDTRNSQDGSNWNEGRYYQEVENILLTLDKFEEVDYRPALQELARALDEPTSFEKPELQAKGLLNEWLEKH